jgi:hypothetical protein
MLERDEFGSKTPGIGEMESVAVKIWRLLRMWTQHVCAMDHRRGWVMDKEMSPHRVEATRQDSALPSALPSGIPLTTAASTVPISTSDHSTFTSSSLPIRSLQPQSPSQSPQLLSKMPIKPITGVSTSDLP